MNSISVLLSKTLEPLGLKGLGIFPHLGMAVLYLLLFWGLWKVLRRSLSAVFRRSGIDETIASFVLELMKYGLFILGLISALGELGINTVSLLTSLGVLGLTVGFAAKDTLSNLIAGLFIFWDRPFRTGDLVEIEGLYGRVQQITLRSTRIVTPDGKMVAYPNTTIVNNKVVSYTNFPHLRLDIDVTIGLNEDLAKVRKLLLEMVAEYDDYLREPAPLMVVRSLNDYNLALQIQVWIEDERRHISLRHALREQVFECLRSANVEMPFETIQLAPVQILERKNI
jgi:small conductance mechanosensitive channel